MIKLSSEINTKEIIEATEKTLMYASLGLVDEQSLMPGESAYLEHMAIVDNCEWIKSRIGISSKIRKQSGETKESMGFVSVRPAHWSEAITDMNKCRVLNKAIGKSIESFDEYIAMEINIVNCDLEKRKCTIFLGFETGYFRVLSVTEKRFQHFCFGVLAKCRASELIRQASWVSNVSLEPKGISLDLPSDPTGVHEMWKLRDIPEGAKRRAALLHWVSDHWRQNRYDPEMEGYVRKHLRGQNECTLGGMKIHITPSAVDMHAVESAKSERRDMRKNLHDRRKRLQRVMA